MTIDYPAFLHPFTSVFKIPIRRDSPAWNWSTRVSSESTHTVAASFSRPLEKAIAIALHAHKGQTDKAGAPYVLHPLRVMSRMSDDTTRMAAVLHDVVEDGPDWTFDRLRAEGIPEEVVIALTFLTKLPEEEDNYEAFIRRVAGNGIARRVKLGDLEDNMDLSRIASPTKRDYRRVEKYRKAYVSLEHAS